MTAPTRVECPRCAGGGIVPRTYVDLPSGMVGDDLDDCPVCDGEGEVCFVCCLAWHANGCGCGMGTKGVMA